MYSTIIDLQNEKEFFKKFSEELSFTVNSNISSPSSFVEEEPRMVGNYANKLGFRFDNYSIRFTMDMNFTLLIDVWSFVNYGLDLTETRKAYKEIQDCAYNFLKDNKIDVYISLDFLHFSDKSVGMSEYFGSNNFADITSKNKTIPVINELKELQNLIPIVAKYFHVSDSGTGIETSKNKFRKIYGIGVIKEEDKFKLGIFGDDLLLSFDSEEVIKERFEFKNERMKELQTLKNKAIKILSENDPLFKFDNKNAVIFKGEKGNISIEFDPFKNEYLMIFFKNRIKVSKIEKFEAKLNKLIENKIS